MSVDFVTAYQEQSRDVLAAILDHSQDCIKLIGLDGNLEFMNENGRKAMQIADFSTVADAHWTALWPEESRDQIGKALVNARAGQKSRFEGYCPTAAGEPRWWDVSVAPVKNGAGEITHILATSRDVTASMNERMHDRIRREKAEQTAEHSEAIAREMRHRLKNQVAVINSISKMLARSTDDAKELQTKLENKLIALSRAQDILTLHGSPIITANQAVSLVLEASGAGERVEVLDLPATNLTEEAVQLLALLLGELQTNSLKYGALNCENGRVTLSGKQNEKVLHLHWHEDCGRAVPRPSHEGVGTKLLRRIGTAGPHAASIQWHSTGPSIDFYLKTAEV